MIPISLVALLLTAACYGFPSGNSLSPSSPNSSHAVAPPNANGVCNGVSNVTVDTTLPDLLDRSQTSSSSLPECSEVEPTAGIISGVVATSPLCTVAPLGSISSSGNGTAGFIDTTLSELVYEYEYSDESLLTWSSTRGVTICGFSMAQTLTVALNGSNWLNYGDSHGTVLDHCLELVHNYECSNEPPLNCYSCGRDLASATVYPCGRALASAALYYSYGRALACAALTSPVPSSMSPRIVLVTPSRAPALLVATMWPGGADFTHFGTRADANLTALTALTDYRDASHGDIEASATSLDAPLVHTVRVWFGAFLDARVIAVARSVLVDTTYPHMCAALAWFECVMLLVSFAVFTAVAITAVVVPIVIRPTRTALHFTWACSRVALGSDLRFVLLAVVLVTLPLAGATDDKKGPPGFSGERADFLAWFMAFSAYVAYKLVNAAPVLEGTLPRPPDPPAALNGRLDANGAPMMHPPAPPAPVDDGHGGVANQAAIDAAEAALAAYNAAPVGVINQSVIDAALEAQRDWDKSNTRLYGLLMQSLPTWLVTSVYNSARNDGVASITYLRNAFDANAGDGGDHAAHLAKLQARTIDARSDVSEADLRKHFDMMVSEAAAISRTGNTPPSDATLIAFYDNALPISYTTMRQHARRSRHTTFLAHHMDIMGQVRAEVNARAPPANAFNARINNDRGGDNGNDDNDGGGGHRNAVGGSNDNPCLRCGQKGHIRPKCRQRKVKCKYCQGDHLHFFCEMQPDDAPGDRRDELSDGALRLIARDCARHCPTDAPPTAPGGDDAAPATPTNTTAHAQAHAAAAAAAANQTDPVRAANAYAAALRGLGYGW